jgi:hypothetical protein
MKLILLLTALPEREDEGAGKQNVNTGDPSPLTLWMSEERAQQQQNKRIFQETS